jgi:transposase InsO family protein
LFDEELKDKTIPHFWNYPRSPKSNAFIERFNRTLREQFLNEYDDVEVRIYKLNNDISELRFWKNNNLLDIQFAKNALLKGIHF